MLFENWDRFVALSPDEKVIQVYKKVKAGKLRKVPEEYESIDIELHDTAEGDLLLTDKRLIHLKYEYKVDESFNFNQMPYLDSSIFKFFLAS